MARSFSNVRTISALVVDRISFAVTRRGYAAASQGVASGAVRSGGTGKNGFMGGEETTAKSKSPWVPDPATGYYRPESHTNEIDAAELREMLLKNTIRRH